MPDRNLDLHNESTVNGIDKSKFLKDLIALNLKQEVGKLSVKEQINDLGFADYMISIATTLLWHESSLRH